MYRFKAEYGNDLSETGKLVSNRPLSLRRKITNQAPNIFIKLNSTKLRGGGGGGEGGGGGGEREREREGERERESMSLAIDDNTLCIQQKLKQ